MSGRLGEAALTVVIPTRDKAAHLRLTLAGLLAQDGEVPFEVVLVNDGSTDDTSAVAEAAQSAGLPLRVVTRGGGGRAAARNAGAADALGELLVFVDDDILVGTGFVAAHAQAHGEGGSGAVVHGPLRELPRAGHLVADGPAGAYASVQRGGYGRTFANALERMVTGMADGTIPPVAPWLSCIGANVSMTRATWRASGGFDESYGVVWGCEDLEFGYRLHAAGAAMRVAPAADGYHLTHPRPDRWAEHQVNLDRFTAQHPDPAVLALPALLASSGSPQRYLDAVNGYRESTVVREESS